MWENKNPLNSSCALVAALFFISGSFAAAAEQAPALAQLRGAPVELAIPVPDIPYKPSFAMEYAHYRGKLVVGIDFNRELMHTLLHLSDYGAKLRAGEMPELAGAALKELGQFKAHPAVLELEAGAPLNWDNKFSYGYFSSYSQHFSRLPEGRRIYEYSDDFLNRVLRGMPKAKKIEYLDAYWEKVRDFYLKAGYEAFFKNHGDRYRSYSDTVYASLPPLDIVKAHEDYHGTSAAGHFFIVPSPLSMPTGGSFGGPMGGSVFNYMGYGFDSSETIAYLGLHEFGHSFCNPVSDKYAAEAAKYAFIIEGIQEEMISQKYGTSWETVMAELLVRSVHARLLLKSEGREAAELFLLDEKYRYKFVFIEDFYALLEEYENNRAKYPTLSEFYPKLLASLADWDLAEVTEAEDPKIWTLPAGSGLKIAWANPKGSGYAAGLRDNDIVTAADGAVPGNSFFVTLEPNRTYTLTVTHAGGGPEIITLQTRPRTLKRPIRLPS